MDLTRQQRDTLTELINIGFGRAASALSILVEQRVIIEAPSVELYPIQRLSDVLDELSDSDITSVHQVFSGRISGAAMLLMDNTSTLALVKMLSGDSNEAEKLSEADREVMRETGNIILNAFTGSFGNLLRVHVSFAVPHVRYDSLRNMLRSLTIDQHELEFALLVRVNFRLTRGNVNGYVIIVMGIQSLSALLEAMHQAGYID